MNDELQSVWEEVVIAWTRWTTEICAEGLMKTTNILRIAGVQADIRTEYLLSTNPERCSFTRPLGTHNVPYTPDNGQCPTWLWSDTDRWSSGSCTTSALDFLEMSALIYQFVRNLWIDLISRHAVGDLCHQFGLHGVIYVARGVRYLVCNK
jgi:hypothetical protein